VAEVCDRCRRIYRGAICPCRLTARYGGLLVAVPLALAAIYFAVDAIAPPAAILFVSMVASALGFFVWVPAVVVALHSLAMNRKP